MQKIVIIKLGADGDVLRTIPLVEAIKNKYPDSNITWVTRPSISEMLVGLPFVTRVLIMPCVIDESFDFLYNFDMETEATELAVKIDAKKKYGFYCEGNYPAAFNTGAEYYLNTVFDDALKKSNKRTYQDMMSELAEIPPSNKRYNLVLQESEREYASRFFMQNNLDGKKVAGIHMGASARWPSKVWHPARLKEFIKAVHKNGYEVLLFGGPNEIEFQKKFVGELQREKILVHH
ncbi:MAG: glycosyltransferase family 9 protein, partial [Nanoarchaeota archaeon]